jgi:hypothetical protein
MEDYIIRDYPKYKSQIKKIQISYPCITNKSKVDELKILLKDDKYNNDYKLWKSGRNYNSKSKNKININGKLYNELGKKFILIHIANYKLFYNSDSSIYYTYEYQYILFKNIYNIDWNDYFLKTKNIYNEIKNEIDEKNKIIDENNKKIIDYNNKVDEIIKKINLLEKWDQYIIFNDVKYGISKIYNNIHRENDCFGIIKFNYHKPCECSTCENWRGCGDPGTDYFKCEKCDYSFSTKHY